MITGYATAEATSALAERFAKLQYRQVGDTGLRASMAGFGGYRIQAGIETHARALRRALESGINLVDTSANYTDGGSETLVGEVLAELIAADIASRRQVIVVSKVGYLQGRNLTMARRREAEGRPFRERVVYSDNLEHCIHPEFLADQLGRSLVRLGLETLDVYLLHNPEYYLEWSIKQGIPLAEARKRFYLRIENAFTHLEEEVLKGRIRYYGVSSNTFPSPESDPEFTRLETIWEIARSISAKHHMRMIQVPLNLLETGAVTESNQSGGRNVLEFAAEHRIGVLANRPLNAFSGNQLIRLADLKPTRAQSENDIIRAIRAVHRSETRLWRRILPELDIPSGIAIRIKDQIAISDTLKHYWRNFGSYERWRQLRENNFQPRYHAVRDYLQRHREGNEDLEDWMVGHEACLEAAFQAVGSIYAEPAARKSARILYAVGRADEDWAGDAPLSRKAFRAIGSTRGITTVLVGMRRESYVRDILEEVKRPVPRKDRRAAWRTLRHELSAERL